MKRYEGGKAVPQGIYLHLATGEITQVHGKHPILPKVGDDYVKIPALLAIVLGPFAGLVFVVFLPLVGIIGVAGLLGTRVWRGILARGTKKQQGAGKLGDSGHAMPGEMGMNRVEETIEEILAKRESRAVRETDKRKQ